jgi:hypothetical protein
MSKTNKEVKIVRSSRTGQYIEIGKERVGKTVGKSALTQSGSKSNSRSVQVLKSASATHSEALKRLKDR